MCTHDANVASYVFFHSRDSRIRQLELELAAAPKQEKVERSECGYVFECFFNWKGGGGGGGGVVRCTSQCDLEFAVQS